MDNIWVGFPQGNWAGRLYCPWQIYTASPQIFVYFMPVINLLLSAERANMCTTERENKKKTEDTDHED